MVTGGADYSLFALGTLDGFPRVVLGTFMNVGGIVVGGLAGLAARRELSGRVQWLLKSLLSAIALWVGFRMVWASVGGPVPRLALQLAAGVVALVAGNLAGKALGLQRQSSHLGRYARDRFALAKRSGRPEPGDGFVICAILFCAAPLAVLGSLQEGLQGDPRILMLKAVMDGLAVMALVRVLGIGAMLSALPVLAYQGTLTLAARVIRPSIVGYAGVLDGWNTVAGVLLAMTPLIILDVRKVPLTDYLPALVLAPLIRVWIP